MFIMKKSKPKKLPPKPPISVRLESVSDYFLGYRRVKGSYNQLFKLNENGSNNKA